jgi:hypothetical protein
MTIICILLITCLLSLFAAAQKVTKNAAAADKRLKINSHSVQENKLGRSLPAGRQGTGLRHIFLSEFVKHAKPAVN